MADFGAEYSDMEQQMRLALAKTIEAFEPVFEAAQGVKTRMIDQEGWSTESAEVIALGYYQFVAATLVQNATKQ